MTPGQPFRLFVPILAGATLRDRVVASMGAAVGLAGVAAVCARLPLGSDGLPALLAPLGASAVLLFAVPASPLAQPWSIFGGSVISGLVGVAAAATLGHGPLAVGVAVGGAILAMSLLRCLHPPGGAMAMSAVIGGPAVWAAGVAFPLVHVTTNAALVIVAGWLFHRVSGHAYPHRAVAPRLAPRTLHRDDIRHALADAGETFDVSEADLEMLLTRAEQHAARRAEAVTPARLQSRYAGTRSKAG